jgi:hypothetical protein
VFSALSGGLSDLFIYDLDTKALRHVTDDAFADPQPTWSPDGRQIAFVTDRFSTDLATPARGQLPAGHPGRGQRDDHGSAHFRKGAKNINPQWTKDGKGLYFLSDTPGSRTSTAWTSLRATSFSSPTSSAASAASPALSPALSVAVDTGRIAYSVYDEDRYEIYSIDDMEKLAGWRVLVEAPRTASVIPGGKDEGKLVEAQKDAAEGPGRRQYLHPQALQGEVRPRLHRPALLVGRLPAPTARSSGAASRWGSPTCWATNR